MNYFIANGKPTNGLAIIVLVVGMYVAFGL